MSDLISAIQSCSVGGQRGPNVTGSGGADGTPTIAAGATGAAGDGRRCPLVKISIGTPRPRRSSRAGHGLFAGSDGGASAMGAFEPITQSAEQNARTMLPSMVTCGVRRSVEPPQCAQRRVGTCEISPEDTMVRPRIHKFRANRERACFCTVERAAGRAGSPETREL